MNKDGVVVFRSGRSTAGMQRALKEVSDTRTEYQKTLLSVVLTLDRMNKILPPPKDELCELCHEMPAQLAVLATFPGKPFRICRGLCKTQVYYYAYNVDVTELEFKP